MLKTHLPSTTCLFKFVMVLLLFHCFSFVVSLKISDNNYRHRISRCLQNRKGFTRNIWRFSKLFTPPSCLLLGFYEFFKPIYPPPSPLNILTIQHSLSSFLHSFVSKEWHCCSINCKYFPCGLCTVFRVCLHFLMLRRFHSVTVTVLWRQHNSQFLHSLSLFCWREIVWKQANLKDFVKVVPFTIFMKIAENGAF